MRSAEPHAPGLFGWCLLGHRPDSAAQEMSLAMAMAIALQSLFRLWRAPVNDAVEEAGAPPQEKMSADRTWKRKERFRCHVLHRQPQWQELMNSPSTFARQKWQNAPVTVILNHFKRHSLCRQIEALLAQSSGPPAHIWVCLFASPMAAQLTAAIKSYNDSRIAVFTSPHNLKYFGRFQLALAAPTRFVLLFDDDMVPGRRYLSTLLHAAGSEHGRGAVLGSIGWLLPRPRPVPDLRLFSYRSLVNDTGGLYVPDLAYDLLVERLLEVDYLCSLWFMETRLARLLFREAPHTFATGEDMQLAHMFRKHANAPSLVLPVLPADRSTWGDTDHKLAYNRFSTGGRKTIELRDSIWWNGVRGGGTLHWARNSAEPPPLGPAAILVVVDGPAHADGLRRVVSRLGASAGSGGSALAVAVSGGLRGACSGIAPRLGLPAAACDERRLRVFDMNVGRDLPTFGHTAVGTSSGGVVVGAPQLAPEPAAPVRTARLEAEALADLSQIVRTVRPSLLVSLDDSSSPTSRATARLAKLGGPPSLALPLAGPAWAIDCLGSLTVPQLHRWGVEPLTIAVFASSVSSPASPGGVRDDDEEDLTDDARLAALHDSLRSAAAYAASVAALPGTPLSLPRGSDRHARDGRTSLTLLLPFDASPAAFHYASRGWEWPGVGSKHVRFRVGPVGGECSTIAQRGDRAARGMATVGRRRGLRARGGRLGAAAGR